MTFRMPAYLEGKPEGDKSLPMKAENGGRHVRRCSANPVRTVRLGLSNLSSRTMLSHIRHTMSEVALL